MTSPLSSSTKLSSFLSNLLDNPVTIILTDSHPHRKSSVIYGLLEAIDHQSILIRIGQINNLTVEGPIHNELVQSVLVMSSNSICVSRSSVFSIESMYNSVDIRAVVPAGESIVLSNGGRFHNIVCLFRRGEG